MKKIWFSIFILLFTGKVALSQSKGKTLEPQFVLKKEVLKKDTLFKGQKFSVVIPDSVQKTISFGNAKKNLMKHGSWINLYDGEIQSYGKFKNGLPVGKWRMPFGNCLIYKKGRIVKHIHVY